MHRNKYVSGILYFIKKKPTENDVQECMSMAWVLSILLPMFKLLGN